MISPSSPETGLVARQTDEPSVSVPPEVQDVIVPVERLLAERRAILPEFIELDAMHGRSGKWAEIRKMLWCSIAVRIREEAKAKNVKMTEAEIEQRAHADPEYEEFLARCIDEHKAWTTLDARLTEIEYRKVRGDRLLNLATAEARL